MNHKNKIAIRIDFDGSGYTEEYFIDWNFPFFPNTLDEFPQLAEFIEVDLFKKIINDNEFPSNYISENKDDYTRDDIIEAFGDFCFSVKYIEWRKRQNFIFPVLYLVNIF